MRHLPKLARKVEEKKKHLKSKSSKDFWKYPVVEKKVGAEVVKSEDTMNKRILEVARKVSKIDKALATELLSAGKIQQVKASTKDDMIKYMAKVAFVMAFTNQFENEMEEGEQPSDFNKDILKDMNSEFSYSRVDLMHSVPEFFREFDLDMDKYLQPAVQKIKKLVAKLENIWGKENVEEYFNKFGEDGAFKLIMDCMGSGVSIKDDTDGETWLEEKDFDTKDLPDMLDNPAFNEALDAFADAYNKYSEAYASFSTKAAVYNTDSVLAVANKLVKAGFKDEARDLIVVAFDNSTVVSAEDNKNDVTIFDTIEDSLYAARWEASKHLLESLGTALKELEALRDDALSSDKDLENDCKEIIEIIDTAYNVVKEQQPLILKASDLSRSLRKNIIKAIDEKNA